MLQPGIDDQHVGGIAAVEHVAVLVKHRIDDDGQFDQVSQRLGHDRKITRGRR